MEITRQTLEKYLSTKRSDFAPKSRDVLAAHLLDGQRQSIVARAHGMGRAQMNGLVNGFRKWLKDNGLQNNGLVQ